MSTLPRLTPCTLLPRHSWRALCSLTHVHTVCVRQVDGVLPAKLAAHLANKYTVDHPLALKADIPKVRRMAPHRKHRKHPK
jgi:hypothetical protein